jgi:hypothetical protein
MCQHLIEDSNFKLNVEFVVDMCSLLLCHIKLN